MKRKVYLFPLLFAFMLAFESQGQIITANSQASLMCNPYIHTSIALDSLIGTDTLDIWDSVYTNINLKYGYQFSRLGGASAAACSLKVELVGYMDASDTIPAISFSVDTIVPANTFGGFVDFPINDHAYAKRWDARLISVGTTTNDTVVVSKSHVISYLPCTPNINKERMTDLRP